MVTKQYNVNFCASDFLLLKIELAKIHFARLNKYSPLPPPLGVKNVRIHQYSDKNQGNPAGPYTTIFRSKNRF